MYLSFAGIIIVYRIFLKKSTFGAAHFPESCQYFCRCRSASFLRRTRAAQSGQYLARLDFGVNLTTAINAFLRQSLRTGGFPFEVRLEQPNKETIAAMLEAERIARDPSVKHYSDVEEALRELKR